MKLSEYVKTFRVLNKLSLRTMADKCGCSFQYLAKLENDEVNNPSLDMVRRIADGTGTSLHELLELVDNVDVKLADPNELNRRISYMQAELNLLLKAKHEGIMPESAFYFTETDDERQLLDNFRSLTDKQQTAVLAMIDSMVQKENE